MRNSVPVSVATLYTPYSKRSRHAIDGSNRIMMPSEWRVEGAPTRFFVVLHPSKDHLVISPPSDFDRFLEDLRRDTADKTKIPELERELNERVRLVNLDGVGRLPLPREFLKEAKIKKHGEIVGRFSKFEIWPCGEREKQRAAQPETAELLDRKLLTL